MAQSKVTALTSPEAYQKLKEDPRAILVDVRSNMEFLFVGHPKGAISIPWIDEPDWKVNPQFATEVRKLLLGGLSCHEDSECAPVILICHSGKRSLDAGECLVKDGFTQVYNVLDGFEGELDEQHHRSSVGGWRYHDLPWEQC